MQKRLGVELNRSVIERGFSHLDPLINHTSIHYSADLNNKSCLCIYYKFIKIGGVVSRTKNNKLSFPFLLHLVRPRYAKACQRCRTDSRVISTTACFDECVVIISCDHRRITYALSCGYYCLRYYIYVVPPPCLCVGLKKKMNEFKKVFLRMFFCLYVQRSTTHGSI